VNILSNSTSKRQTKKPAKLNVNICCSASAGSTKGAMRLLEAKCLTMVQPIQIGHAIKPVSVLRMVFPPHGALSMTIVCSLDEALN
jgi:hypothetical protein